MYIKCKMHKFGILHVRLCFGWWLIAFAFAFAHVKLLLLLLLLLVTELRRVLSRRM